MKVDFIDKDLQELIETGSNSKYKKYTRNAKFMSNLLAVYGYMNNVSKAGDLRQISFLHYEQLSKTNGKSSVRIVNNMVERLIFQEYEEGVRIEILTLDDSHY